MTALPYGSTFMNNTATHGGAIALFQGTFLDSSHSVIIEQVNLEGPYLQLIGAGLL